MRQIPQRIKNKSANSKKQSFNPSIADGAYYIFMVYLSVMTKILESRSNCFTIDRIQRTLFYSHR